MRPFASISKNAARKRREVILSRHLIQPQRTRRTRRWPSNFPSCTFVSFVVSAVAFDLLCELLLSLNHQVRLRVGGARAGLSAADCNQVVASRNETISRFIHIAQVAWSQGELDVFLLAGFEVNASEPAQRTQGCAR